MIRRLVLLLFIGIQYSFPQVTVVEDSLFSPSLNSYTSYCVVLPEGYAKGVERYPVLYLLHGLGGDYTNWKKLTSLLRYAKDHRLIIITPDGKNSWYSNSAVRQYANYESMIVDDLIPAVEKKYRIIQTKYNRAIAGLSMGGYGAIKFGLKYPGKFCFVGAMSPSIQFPAGLEDSVIVARRSKEFLFSIREAFDSTRNDRWAENDVFLLAKKSNGAALPFFYLSIGSQDGLLELVDLTHDFAAVLRSRNADFELHETPGGHNWKFWDKEIKIVLQRFTDMLGKKK